MRSTMYELNSTDNPNTCIKLLLSASQAGSNSLSFIRMLLVS